MTKTTKLEARDGPKVRPLNPKDFKAGRKIKIVAASDPPHIAEVVEFSWFRPNRKPTTASLVSASSGGVLTGSGACEVDG